MQQETMLLHGTFVKGYYLFKAFYYQLLSVTGNHVIQYYRSVMPKTEATNWRLFIKKSTAHTRSGQVRSGKI